VKGWWARTRRRAAGSVQNGGLAKNPATQEKLSRTSGFTRFCRIPIDYYSFYLEEY
jgi:hypothetical protein